MRKIYLLLVLFVMSAPAMAEDINLRSIGYNEVMGAGEENVFFVGVRNVGTSKLEDVQVRVDSLDFDMFALSDQVDISRRDSSSFVIPAYIPANTKRGYYTLRFTITDDDDQRRLYYRYIFVR